MREDGVALDTSCKTKFGFSNHFLDIVYRILSKMVNKAARLLRTLSLPRDYQLQRKLRGVWTDVRKVGRGTNFRVIRRDSTFRLLVREFRGSVGSFVSWLLCRARKFDASVARRKLAQHVSDGLREIVRFARWVKRSFWDAPPRVRGLRPPPPFKRVPFPKRRAPRPRPGVNSLDAKLVNVFSADEQQMVELDLGLDWRRWRRTSEVQRRRIRREFYERGTVFGRVPFYDPTIRGSTLFEDEDVE